MPPKSLFDGSHRPDKLVMPSCSVCNKGTSTADLTAAIVSRWAYDANASELSDHRRLAARMRTQAREVFDEWMEMDNPIRRILARQHLRKYGVPVPRDAAMASIGERTVRQLNLFAHKAALALYFEHFRKPLSSDGTFCAFWRTKEDYYAYGLPSSLIEMLPQYGTIVQGQWSTHEIFEYRHAINREEGLFGFFARLRRGLFISGFAVRNAAVLPDMDGDWQTPGDLLTLVDTPRFAEKV